jgi:anti-anti-sigma factor
MQCGRGKVSPFQLYALDEDALALSGEVDRFSAAALERVLTIGTDHSTNTILDLTQLNFMDHHGLQALAEVAGRWEEGDAKLSVRNAPPIVRRMSELLEIDL